MGLTVTVTPGKQFASTEKLTIPKLNQLGQPTFTVTGTVGTSEITAGSVTADKTIAGAHFYTSSVTFSAGDYTLTFSPAITITDGTVIAFKANAPGVPNVTTGIRLVIGASTKKLFKNKTETLTLGDVVTNQIVEARYDTSGDSGAGAWQWTSQTSNAVDYYTATATGTNNYALTLTPPASQAFTLADLDGKRIRFKVPNTNTGACTVAVTLGGTALAAKNLYKHFNTPLVANDLRQYQIAEIVYENNATAATDAYQLQTPVGNNSSSAAVIATTRNLVIYPEAANKTTRATITADEVVLKSTAGQPILHSGVSLTVDVNAGVGLNAFETGASRATDHWYYLWLISNESTIASVLEDAGAGNGALPAGPDLSNATFTGYNYKALIGQIRLNATGSGEIVQFIQRDRSVWTVEQVVFAAKAPLGADTWENLTTPDIEAFRAAVPPTATSCSGFIGSDNTTDAIAAMFSGTNPAGGVDSTIQVGAMLFNGSAIGTAYNSFGTARAFSNLPVNTGTARNIQWKSRLTTLTVSFSVSGYTF